MPRKQHPLDKLVKTIGQTAKTQEKPETDFYTDITEKMQAGQAAEFIRTYAEQDFDQTDEGAELAVLEDSYAVTTTQRDATKQVCASLKKQRDNTPYQIRSTPQGDGEQPNKRTPFYKWDVVDQCATVILIFLITAVWGMGGANVYAVLLNSGQPLYIEQPWIAVSLSMIVPAFSACLKFSHHIFIDPKAKHRFAQGVYLSTVLALLGWTIAFSISFQGVNGEFDWPDLGEETTTDYTSIVLVWLQLSAEILIGGALAIALTDRVSKYFPNCLMTNPVWLSLDAAYKAECSALDPLDTQYSVDKKRLVRLRNKRQTYVQEKIVKFIRK